MTDISLEEAVKGRHSVRGFLADPVPQALLNKVFELAQWAPSGTNIQPWQVYVASGATRDALRTEFIHRAQTGQAPTLDYADKGKVGEPWRERRRDCAKALYTAMDIAWEDKEARARASFRNFELFDAPHVAFLCMNEVFGMASAADLGMYAQTLMLSMTAHGLASCAQGTMAHYPDLVRETFNLDPMTKVLFGISFGYEDPAIAANQTRTVRAPLEQSVVFRSA
ncbi:MAG: nitroreductase family protein [Porticoccaceae bacterium]|nr:nitroreductase family protein [Porticoccaceae bacterium]